MAGKAKYYRDGDRELHGYAAMPSGEGQKPGVLVFHDGFGLGDHARERADRLAEAGYVALAADMFGGGKMAADLNEALALLSEFEGKPGVLRGRALAARETLVQLPGVDPERLYAIGFCFGGKTALEVARAGVTGVRAVASFHGLLTTDAPAQPDAVKASVLVLNGAIDPLVPEPDVLAFQAEMEAAGADWQLVNYGHAKHAFTLPLADHFGLQHLGYDRNADLRSWVAMLALFHETAFLAAP